MAELLQREHISNPCYCFCVDNAAHLTMLPSKTSVASEISLNDRPLLHRYTTSINVGLNWLTWLSSALSHKYYISYNFINYHNYYFFNTTITHCLFPSQVYTPERHRIYVQRLASVLIKHFQVSMEVLGYLESFLLALDMKARMQVRQDLKLQMSHQTSIQQSEARPPYLSDLLPFPANQNLIEICYS